MTRVESGIKAGPFTIRFIQGQNVKLLVGRNDRGELPHLTISWRNPTGEIDIHLTTRIKGGLDHYETLGKISESEATKFAEEFGARLGIFLQPRIDHLRKIRPGWLARKGYWIMHLSNDTQNRLIETLAPKKKHHGKWTRFIEDNVFEQLGQSEEFVDSFYHPSVLHELAGLGCREVVFATSTHRKRRGRLIGLCLMVRPNGQRYWTRIDKLTQLMLRMSEEFFADCVGRFVPAGTWERIHSALRLDEIGIALHGTRSRSAAN